MPNKKLGANAPMPNYGNPPQDSTRVAQNQSYPPDQSVYSNPITANQVTSVPRSMNPGQISSPNSLPTIPNPQQTPIYQ